MGDLAEILGLGKVDPPAPSAPPPPAPAGPNRARKKLGVSREVMHLLNAKHNDSNDVELPMSVPTFAIKLPTSNQKMPGSVKVGSKWIAIQKPARKWTWAPFSSSSRTDGALFHHWVRANVEYPDYPYARFDIHLDPIAYTVEEYDAHVVSDAWTKSETDQLLEMARRFELRWPIIHDRWLGRFGVDCTRRVEDLQHRYYTIAAALLASRASREAAAEAQQLVTASQVTLPSTTATTAEENPVDEKAVAENLLLETAAARSLALSDVKHQPLIQNIGTGSTNKTFDLDYERERRAHLEALWNRPKEEEQEEIEIRIEYVAYDVQVAAAVEYVGSLNFPPFVGSSKSRRSYENSKSRTEMLLRRKLQKKDLYRTTLCHCQETLRERLPLFHALTRPQLLRLWRKRLLLQLQLPCRARRIFNLAD
jgi:DNA methyltransferase 1-associated protein 1